MVLKSQPVSEFGRIELGFAGQDDKDGLRHILGQGRIFNLPQGGGVDKIDVAIDEIGERFGRACLGICDQVICVSSIVAAFNRYCPGKPGLGREVRYSGFYLNIARHALRPKRQPVVMDRA